MQWVPHLTELQERYEDRGFTVVGVSNEERELLLRSMEKNEIHYPSARVEGRAADEAYGVDAYPRTYLIGRDGSLIWGGHPYDLKEEWIREALDRSP